MKKLIFYLHIFSIVAISCQSNYINNPSLINKIDEGVGVLGPIILEFPDPIRDGSIEKEIIITPMVGIKFQWQGIRLNIFPETFFSFNQEYQLFLGKNALFHNENLAQPEYFWNIKTHPECLIYIGSATESPEIWKACLNDNSRTQLSRSKGKIIDFNISNDGQWIIYSIQNELNGTEIWLMDRNGRDNHVLYKCNEDLCREPIFASDGLSVIFIRSSKKIESLAGDKNDDILLINITSGKESMLLTDKRLKVTFLQLSADQKYISFFESFSSSFWIWNLKTNQITELSSSEGLGGFWKRNENSFIFAGLNYWGGIPYGQINQWDEKTASIQHLFGDENDPNEYVSPQWRPQGDWIAAAYRPVEGSASKQIALFSSDGMQRVMVTKEQAFSYSFYSWSYDGEKIAFQRFQIGVSGSVPEIGLWRRSDQSNVIIEKNASSPKWIP